MFRLYHSNDLEVLKGLLLNEIRQNPPGVFDQEQILVQSQGMAHWLRLQLADGLGVSAQVSFPLPSAYVWKIFNALKPDLPERSHFEKQAMAWKLMRLLPTLVKHPRCEGIQHYLENDPHGLRCYELAHKIADVFDQYLVYRPDWLLRWEQGKDDVDDTDVSVHPWQPLVWRALVEDSERLQHSLDHRARLTLSLPELMKNPGERLQHMPKRLFVFGIAALPGGYWEVLNAISTHIEVHYYLLNPCRNYWGDIVSDKQRKSILQRSPEAIDYLERGNPLLASWGRLGKDFLTLVHDTAAEGRLQDIEAYTDPVRESLLQHIQSDLLELHDGQLAAYTPEALRHSKFKRPVNHNDDSLKVIAAHSPLREVQRLHDQLLQWFTDDPSLKPRDIVVMVPDVDQYAPYIDAVFASAAEGQRIPWAIADQSQVQENPLIESVLGLLSLCDGRVQLTDVLDWLDVAAIRQRFEIGEDDLEQIRDWLDRAAIRWGLDGEHRRALGFPAFTQNSWRKGLRQLLLGFILPNDDSQEVQHWQDDWPVYGVEGNASALLGQLLSLLDTLSDWQAFLSQSHSIDDWMSAIPRLLDDMYAPDLDEGVQLQRVRDGVLRWQQQLQDADYGSHPDDVLSPQVVRSWFNEHLAQQGGWQRFLAGPVNFCTLMPMRSIPFKVVCLLGMNDQDYPRPVTPVGFDLMVSGKARRGDRSRREDDRYLVLEALCSAQQHFYISYRGRDARENHELQPSVLINELLDYVGDAFCLSGDEAMPAKQSRQALRHWLIEELPLQPFNRHAFSLNDSVAYSDAYLGDQADSQVYKQESSRKVSSFNALWAGVANAAYAETKVTPFFQQPLPLPQELNPHSVLWADVKDALLNPTHFFMKRRLRVSPELYLNDVNNEETFTPDGLEQYLIKQRWLSERLLLKDSAQLAAALQSFTAQEQALGHLPVNELGRLQARDLISGLEPLAERLSQLCQGAMVTASQSVELTIADPFAHGSSDIRCTISGDVASSWNNIMVQWRVGDVRGEHLLNAWLDLIFSTACNDQPDAMRLDRVVVIGGKKELQDITLMAPSTEQAQAYMQLALDYYWQCWQSPPQHMPSLFWSLLHVQDEDVEKEIIKAANSEYSEFNRVSMQRCYPELAQQLINDEFASWKDKYHWIWSALQDCLLEGEDE
ncbi:MAG: exodeoxyribonuclease V subunit gamma [Oleibacter sp.]|nr:exodeoxyribonuclease V subunit gamma [Thalassolituus sp.]